MKDNMIDLNDKTIRSIGWCVEPNYYEEMEVGEHGITKIDCKEMFCGDYSIFWLQVWKGKKLFARYNARNVDNIMYGRRNG